FSFLFGNAEFAAAPTPSLSVWQLPYGKQKSIELYPKAFDIGEPASGTCAQKYVYIFTEDYGKSIAAYDVKLRLKWNLPITIQTPFQTLSPRYGAAFWDVSRDDKRQAVSFDKQIRIYSMPSKSLVSCSTQADQMTVLFSQ